MEPPNGHPCPECGAPRQRDNTPACACTHRASEALRDARTAQVAAAEDFDPLRIRPYVEIDAGPTGPDTGEGPPSSPAAATTPPPLAQPVRASSEADPATPSPSAPPAEATPPAFPAAHPQIRDGAPGRPGGGAPEPPRAAGPRPATRGTPDTSATSPHPNAPQAPAPAPRQPGTGPAGAPHAQGPGSAARSPSPADATMPLRPVDRDATAVLPAAPATSVIPTPLAPAAAEPSVTDLRLFDGTVGAERGTPEAGEAGARRSGRRRRTLLIAAAGACVAVVTAAGYATGLFSYESPSRDTALPDDIRASVPDAPPSSAASTPPQGSASAASPAPAAPRPSPSRTGSPSASPSPSAPSASASPSQSPSPSASPPSATATGPGQAPADNSRQNGGPAVLRLGDRGPEVTELQLRLRQLYLYDDDADGTFDDRLEEAVRTYQWSRGIQSDDLGVYDRETRTKLESETRKP